MATKPNVLAFLGVLAVLAAFGVASSLLLTVVGITDRADKMVVVGIAALEALATAVAAVYAVFLFRLSRRIQAENIRAAKDHDRELADTRAVMAAQHTAMERMAEAMTANAETAKRALIAGHPPILTVKNAFVTTGGGAGVRVKLDIENVGRTTATIESVMSYDIVARRYASAPSPQHIPATHADLVGVEIPVFGIVEVVHACSSIRPEDISPPGDFEVLWESEPLNAIPADPALWPVLPETTLHFHIIVGYFDETGNWAKISAKFDTAGPRRRVRLGDKPQK